MNKKSVVYKLIIMFTSITGVVLILTGMLVSILFNMDYKAEKIRLLEKQFNIIEKSTIDYLKNQSTESYDEVKNILYTIEGTVGMEIMVVDTVDIVYMVGGENAEKYKYTKVSFKDDIKDKLERGNVVISEFKDETGNNKSVYIKPIFYNKTFMGTIVMMSESTYGKVPLRIYISIWMAIAIALVASSIIVYFFAHKVIIKPLEQINNAARKLAKGEVEKRVEIKSADEIGELGESFNIMAESLEAVDKTRKEFISNVSHELRSPITSIKGFISGIIDGVIPKDKENYYLNIVYDEVDRLARLVNDLLDMSAMEAGKFKLTVRPIDLYEIIGLCVVNLQGKIETKKLNVDVIFEDEHQYVLADRDRIIQVITNLLENAIKYGEEAGKIIIKSHKKGDKVYVSVFNSGPLIPKESINNIWDRFYKSDKSRTNKISTGLGLAIVRLILTQHKEDIWVKNIEDKGVEFTFTLARVD